MWSLWYFILLTSRKAETDTECRRNGKDCCRVDSFLGRQGLYVFPREGGGDLTTLPYLGTHYSYACCTAYIFRGFLLQFVDLVLVHSIGDFNSCTHRNLFTFWSPELILRELRTPRRTEFEYNNLNLNRDPLYIWVMAAFTSSFLYMRLNDHFWLAAGRPVRPNKLEKNNTYKFWPWLHSEAF